MRYMKKTIFAILFLTTCLMCARAETIILRTGAPKEYNYHVLKYNLYIDKAHLPKTNVNKLHYHS